VRDGQPQEKDIRSFQCDSCKARAKTEDQKGSSATPEIECPHRLEAVTLSAVLSARPNWHPVLVREHVVSAYNAFSRLRPVREGDQVQDRRSEDRQLPRIEIPDGIETACLKRSGFRDWDELYTQRQLSIVSDALTSAADLNASGAVKEHIRLAILGSTEMAGYVCRWERYNPKLIEAIANHRFSRSTVTVETNLLSPSGRGTIPRRFEAAVRALRWMHSQGFPARTVHARATSQKKGVDGALVVTGSSERQLLHWGAAQLVFTDPPYHDDLQYGELARLFHIWMTQSGTCEPGESLEAVPNTVRGSTTKDYEDKVAACLTESRRTLASIGRLLLTFHNRDMNAWEALGQALSRAGFDVVALATVAAENPADHSKRGRQSFLSDLVVECRPRSPKRRRSAPVQVSGTSKGAERKNLQAIGLALGEFVNQEGGDLDALFEGHLRRLTTKKVLIQRGGR
jgi:putative DNA methylase